MFEDLEDFATCNWFKSIWSAGVILGLVFFYKGHSVLINMKREFLMSIGSLKQVSLVEKGSTYIRQLASR